MLRRKDAETPRRADAAKESLLIDEFVSRGREVSASARLRVSASVLSLAFYLLLFAFPTASAHEPITTRVRFNKELVRIFQRSCLGCHRPGGVAMSLATYEEARPWAKAIKEEILERRMPPWRAVKGYGEYSNAPRLTQREVDLIVNWVEGGAPKGDDKDLPAEPLYSNDWQLGKPDLVLKSEATEVASDADRHLTFTLATNLKEDRWLEAIDLKPDNGSVVHCATFYVDRGQGPRLGTWVPGQRTVRLPGGAAQLLPAGSRVAVKIHYRGAGEAAKDQSAVGLYFSKSQPRKQAQEIAITDSDAVIPVGAEIQRVQSSLTLSAAAEAVAIRPLAHPLLVSLQATARRPDGTEEVLIWARGYGHDWQQTYFFKRPASLPKGTRVEVVAYFDNSEANRNNPNDPPRQVRLSEISPNPLCALTISTTIARDAGGNR
jgi:mono/diheme cytochrome c family protein